MRLSINLYQLKKSVYKYYRENVKGNEGLTDSSIQKKLSRNIALAIRVPVKGNKVIYLYGNLHIHTIGNKIIHIVNHRGKNDWFYLDRKKKNKLDIELGLEFASDQWKEVGSLDYLDDYSKGFIERMLNHSNSLKVK